MAHGDHLAQFKADQLDAWERRLAQFSNRSDSTGYVGRIGVEVLTELRQSREQAEALATALEAIERETEHVNTRRGSRNGRIREAADAALRAYREGDCPGCSFQRQTGGNHDDVPTGNADPNCAYREATP